MSGYKLTKTDLSVCAVGILGNIALFSWVLGDSDSCNVDNPVSAFTGTRVTILRTTCDDESESTQAARFALLLIAAFALRFARSLLSWEVAQESRVLLKQNKDARPQNCCDRYQALYFVNNLSYIIEIILIMGRNLWVYIVLLLAQQLATYEFFRRSDSDQERMTAAPSAVVAREGTGDTGSTIYKF